MSNQHIRFKPISLEKQSELSVRINNLLLNKSRVFSFSLNEHKSFRVRLVPANSHSRTASSISLTLGLGDSVAGLWLSNWPLVDGIREFIPEGMLERLPENLGIALLENAMEPLLVMAEHGLGTKIKVQALSADINSKLYTLPLGFELTELKMKAGKPESSVQIFGVLMLEERTYPLLQERLRFWPSDFNADWDQLEIPIRLEISRTQLSITEINSLSQSDVIMLNDTEFYTHNNLTLCLHSGLCCKAKFNPDNNQLVISSGWNTMSDQEQKNAIDNLNQVPVQLTFDIGSKSISFNEIRQLRAGYIVELPSMLPEVVQIRSQNKLLGTGELVDVNGRVGVRILNIFGNKTKAG